jgi:hypothetical protein
MKFKIEYVKNKIHPGGWIGMNANAASELKVPFHHKHKNVIEVYSKVPKAVMHNTEKHEEIEYTMMRRGLKYHPAHKIALKYENERGHLKSILNKIKKTSDSKGGRK